MRVSFMQHTMNAGIPSNNTRYSYGNIMGARVPVSPNGSSNPDTANTNTPCGKWQKAKYHAPAQVRELKKHHPTGGGALGEESPRRAPRHRHYRCSELE